MTDPFQLEHALYGDEGVRADRGRWPRELACVVDTLLDAFIRRGVAEALAAELAEAGAIALGKERGGRALYLPSGRQLELAARDRRIYLEWRGNNRAELMERYGLGTERRLEQIVAEQAALVRRRIQPDLFPDP